MEPLCTKQSGINSYVKNYSQRLSKFNATRKVQLSLLRMQANAGFVVLVSMSSGVFALATF
jgi:hypothetical protein